MIHIVYDRRRNQLTVTGHAKSAQAGHDLVCAAASILVYTLAANVSDMADCGQVREPELRLTVGDTQISCVPCEGQEALVAQIFSAICVGFAILASQFPEYVSYADRA